MHPDWHPCFTQLQAWNGDSEWARVPTPHDQSRFGVGAHTRFAVREVRPAGSQSWHAATAPNAVLRVLPSLPNEQWAPSASAAWSASAAIHAVYSSPTAAPLPKAPATEADAFDRTAQHGDEHVIKLADTALDTYSWTGDERALAAVETAALLIEPAEP